MRTSSATGRARRRTPRPARRRVLLALGVVVVALAGWKVHDARQPGSWQHVLATREGMIGDVTSSRTIVWVTAPSLEHTGVVIAPTAGNGSVGLVLGAAF